MTLDVTQSKLFIQRHSREKTVIMSNVQKFAVEIFGGATPQ